MPFGRGNAALCLPDKSRCVPRHHPLLCFGPRSAANSIARQPVHRGARRLALPCHLESEGRRAPGCSPQTTALAAWALQQVPGSPPSEGTADLALRSLPTTGVALLLAAGASLDARDHGGMSAQMHSEAQGRRAVTMALKRERKQRRTCKGRRST